MLLKAYKLKLSHIAAMEGLKFDELFVKLFYMRACALPQRSRKNCEWKSICMDKLGELLRQKNLDHLLLPEHDEKVLQLQESMTAHERLRRMRPLRRTNSHGTIVPSLGHELSLRNVNFGPSSNRDVVSEERPADLGEMRANINEEEEVKDSSIMGTQVDRSRIEEEG